MTSVVLLAPDRANVSIRLTALSSRSLAINHFGGTFTTTLIDGTWQIEQATIVQDPH
ncbi:MAG: hypothetical protein U0232_23115 [Thermomicrobiales bacterium]